MTAADRSDLDRSDLLTPGEVAGLFRVSARTVTRWARAGKISTLWTLGGHRRFRRREVEAALRAHRSLDV